MKPHIIYPDFLPEYDCKCGNCRRTCCSGDWEISLSKEEYFADTNSKLGPEMLEMAEKGMAVKEKQTDEGRYAEMIIGPNKRCVFFNCDGLCAWKLKSGADVGSVCRDFPRLYIRFLDDTYIFPSVSCEAIVELMLKETEPIRLIHQEKTLSDCRYYARVVKEQIIRRPLLELYPQFIEYGLGILQDRSLALDERMQLLALAIHTIDQMERSGAVKEIFTVLDGFVAEKNRKQYLDLFSTCYGSEQALLLACGDTYSLFSDKEMYQNTARKILQGLGIGLTERFEPRLLDRETYVKKKELWKNTWKEIEYFLEHMMVGIFLHNIIPMGEPGPWANFQYMMACYALIKGGIIGNFDTPPGKEALVDTIVEIMRMCSHNNALYDKILCRFKEVKMDSLAAIISLACG